LGCPVVAISASTRQGINELKTLINQAVLESPVPHLDIEYHPAIEQAITDLSVALEQKSLEYQCDLRWLAIRLLERDTLARKIAGAELVQRAEELEQVIEQASDDEVDILAADAMVWLIKLAIFVSIKSMKLAEI
jgi:ferrous iron transport protein B